MIGKNRSRAPSSPAASPPRLLSQRIPRRAERAVSVHAASSSVPSPSNSDNSAATHIATTSQAVRRSGNATSSESSGTLDIPIRPPSAANPVTAATPAALNPIASAASSVSTASTAPQPRSNKVLVPRPPLNVYVKIAVVRDGNDAVVCEDFERPGKTKKMVVMDQLSENKATGGVRNTDEGESNGVSMGSGGSVTLSLGDHFNEIPFKDERKKKTTNSSSHSHSYTGQQFLNNSNANSNKASSKNSNKKEIPVPTITIVRRYDRDVAPDYDIPQSYVRYVCPSYNEVLEDTVDYNLDAEDEAWWRNNQDFGPSATANIIVEGGGEGGRTEAAESGSGHRSASAGGEHCRAVKSAAAAEKETPENTNRNAKPHISKNVKGRQINRKGQFVKRNSSKQNMSDGNNDGERRDEGMSSCSSNENNTPSSPCTPHTTYTAEQVIALNPKYLYSRYSTRYLLRKHNPKLPLAAFEHMLDVLEKTTGFDAIVTSTQAEEVMIRRVPVLEDLFGMLSERDRRWEEEEEERHASRWLTKEDDGRDAAEASHVQSSSLSLSFPAFGPPITLGAVICQVHTYWLLKRSRLRRPLLRRYWPPTPAGDTNPHQVFRQPSKENRRRLRKKKQNDAEAYQKMARLKAEFERVRVLCELAVKREEVHRMLVELTNEYFEERLFGWIDTSCSPRRSECGLDQRRVESVLNVPKYFDDGPILKVKGWKKRKRSSWAQVQAGELPMTDGLESSGRYSSTMASTHAGNFPPRKTSLQAGTALLSAAFGPMRPLPPPCRNAVVAGHDGGLPAPSFLEPLPSRNSWPATWEGAVPNVLSSCDGVTMTGFRHRPRLGRGGRIIIDRVPCPSLPCTLNASDASVTVPLGSPSPQTVITYGSGMARSGHDTATLGADGPSHSLCLGFKKGVLTMGPGDGGAGADDASTMPKAPPSHQLLDLLPKKTNTALLSRRIEEVCALGLLEDYEKKGAVGIERVGLGAG